MREKKTSKKLKIAAALAAAALAAGSIIWVTFGNGVKMAVPGYQVDRVLDGDTFYTTDGLRVRLANIDTPEVGLCGSEEATKRLKELISKRSVYLKTQAIDPFYRSDSFVYTSDGLVNLKMLEEGMAYYYPRHSVEEFKKAGEQARKLKKGIFGPKCTQMVNRNKPSCNIKGNINDSSGKDVKHYYVPECQNYSITVVELYKGDQWFCTEAEAKKAGFKKPKQC